MAEVHGLFPGGTQVVIEVDRTPLVARTFVPKRILSVHNPDYINEGRQHDLDGKTFYVYGDNDGEKVPWGNSKIPSLQLRVVQ